MTHGYAFRIDEYSTPEGVSFGRVVTVHRPPYTNHTIDKIIGCARLPEGVAVERVSRRLRESVLDTDGLCRLSELQLLSEFYETVKEMDGNAHNRLSRPLYSRYDAQDTDTDKL